jgi:hypothetical protein
MRRTVVSLGVVGVLAVVAVPAALAGTVTPPAGIPNLAEMVLQPTDLMPGVNIAAQAYGTPPKGFTADYSSFLTGATTVGGVKFNSLQDDVGLASTTTAVSNLFMNEHSLFTSRKGRRLIAKSVVKAFGKKAHLETKDVKFGSPQSAGIGTQSFEELLTIKVGHRVVPEAIIEFSDGDFYADLVAVGELNTPISLTDITALGGTIDAHIQAGQGTTGASGTTGTTGTS